MHTMIEIVEGCDVIFIRRPSAFANSASSIGEPDEKNRRISKIACWVHHFQ